MPYAARAALVAHLQQMHADQGGVYTTVKRYQGELRAQAGAIATLTLAPPALLVLHVQTSARRDRHQMEILVIAQDRTMQVHDDDALRLASDLTAWLLERDHWSDAEREYWIDLGADGEITVEHLLTQTGFGIYRVAFPVQASAML